MTDDLKEFFDRRGYYEIRLESIGGLGANLCTKMMGELAVRYLNLNSAGFSSYGSEKTGTPVKGHIRLCSPEKEILVHSPVLNPNLLVIFHQAVTQDKNVWKGCTAQTKILTALDRGQDELMESLPEQAGECYVVNAREIAMESKSRLNTVMFGAMARVMGFIDLEDVRQICKDTLGRKYPDALEGNLKGIDRGFEQVRLLDAKRDKKDTGSQTDSAKTAKDAEWGYRTAPIGGINPRFGNTVVSDLSPSRQGYIPVFIKERCINCGLCDSTCPDMVFQFSRGEYNGKEMMVNQGLDYYHCKGCMRCVDVCPVNALVRGLEADNPQKKYFMQNQDMLRVPDYYVEAGPDGYITSEAHFTEKRIKGGEV